MTRLRHFGIIGMIIAGLAMSTYAIMAPLATKSVTATSVSGAPGETVTVSINLDNQSGLAAYDVQLDYDSTVLTPTAVTAGNILPDANFMSNITIPGQVLFGNMKTTGVTGTSAGNLATVTFTIKTTATKNSPLTLTTVNLADENSVAIIPTLTNGTVSVAGVGVLSKFDVTIVSAVTAGAATNLTVTARDTFNNVITGFTGTINISSTDANVGKPADYTFVGGDNGTHTFTGGVTLKTAGTQTVTVTSGTVSNTSATITVSPAAASTILVASSKPTIVTNGTDTATITGTIQDQFGNTITNYNAANVVFSLDSTTFATFGGQQTVTVTTGNITNGVAQATLNSVQIAQSGTVQVSATSGALTSNNLVVQAVNKLLDNITIERVDGGMVNTTSPKVGETVQFKATGHYKYPGGAVDPALDEVITNTVTWGSSVPANGDFLTTAGKFTALVAGATNVTATVAGPPVVTSIAAITMNVQAAAPVVINTTNLPTVITSGGTIDFGAAGVATGGTGVGLNYTIDPSSPVGGNITAAGLFTAGPNAGVYTIKVADNASGAFKTYAVKELFTITPTSWNFLTTDAAKTFTVAGAGTDYVWDIMASLTATTPVTTPDDYGIWSGTKTTTVATNDFTPNAAVTALKTFFVRVTVTGDTDLTSDNGLDKRTVGPFNVIPMAAYTVNVKDAAGIALGGATVTVNYAAAAAPDTTTAGKYIFTLPDTGGTYLYNVSLAGYVSQAVSSALKTVTATLQVVDKTITGTVTPLPGTSGATVTAFIPTALATQYSATADGTYTINLPKGAAATGWTVVASNTGYTAATQTGIAAGATAVDFSLAALTGTAPDAGAGGGGQTATANGQTTTVQVPAGGLTVDGLIIITQTAKTLATSSFTSASPTYIYEIKAQDTSNVDLPAADIKRIIITIPVDLSAVKPGDLENGAYRIYSAATQALLEAGSVEAVPAGNILSTDYVGNGLVGSVTFWVDHLSFFGIGGGGGGTTSTSGCFIATAAYGSYFEKHVEILRNFRDAYLLTNDWGRTFVGFYYRHSPALANFIAKKDGVRAVVRLGLAPVVGVAYVTIHTTPAQKVLILLLLIGIMTAGMVMILRMRRFRRIVG